MKFRITDATNFMRIFCLPNTFPSNYCFQGGYPVQIRLVDWFNPFDQRDFWGDKIKEFDSTDESYQKHIDGLRNFIKEKGYCLKTEFTYMAVTDYGDSFIINPEKRSNDLQNELDVVKRKVLKNND